MTVDPVATEIAALRERMDLIWQQHEREHVHHEASHTREHEFAQKAVDTAAELAKANKADANEWRQAMTDRERRFATKEDVATVLQRLDSIERAALVAAERDRQRLISDAEAKQEADRRQASENQRAEQRQTRQQWQVGLVITVVVVLVNIAIRLA